MMMEDENGSYYGTPYENCTEDLSVTIHTGAYLPNKSIDFDSCNMQPMSSCFTMMYFDYHNQTP